MDIVYWIIFALMCSFYVGVWLLASGCERRFVADPHRYVPNCGMSPVPASEGGRL